MEFLIELNQLKLCLEESVVSFLGGLIEVIPDYCGDIVSLCRLVFDCFVIKSSKGLLYSNFEDILDILDYYIEYFTRWINQSFSASNCRDFFHLLLTGFPKKRNSANKNENDEEIDNAGNFIFAMSKFIRVFVFHAIEDSYSRFFCFDSFKKLLERLEDNIFSSIQNQIHYNLLNIGNLSTMDGNITLKINKIKTDFSSFKKNSKILYTSIPKIPKSIDRDFSLLKEILTLAFNENLESTYSKTGELSKSAQCLLFYRTWEYKGRIEGIHSDFGRLSFTMSERIGRNYHCSLEDIVEILLGMVNDYETFLA